MRIATNLKAQGRANGYSHSQLTSTRFYGVNRSLTVADGELNEMMNLTGDYFPMMAPSLPRVKGMYDTLRGVTYWGSLAKGNDIYTCAGTGFYVNGKLLTDKDGNAISLQDKANGTGDHKIMVSMGANICIWPDKWYYNTVTGEYGRMYQTVSNGAMTFAPCTLNGSLISVGNSNYTAAADAPKKPANGAYWFDTKNNKLQIYAESKKAWEEVTSTYIRIRKDGIDQGIEVNDTVFIKEWT